VLLRGRHRLAGSGSSLTTSAGVKTTRGEAGGSTGERTTDQTMLAATRRTAAINRPDHFLPGVAEFSLCDVIQSLSSDAAGVENHR
jgi:hypothetical protein